MIIIYVEKWKMMINLMIFCLRNRQKCDLSISDVQERRRHTTNDQLGALLSVVVVIGKLRRPQIPVRVQVGQTIVASHRRP